MKAFEWAEPTSLEQAVKLLGTDWNQEMLLAGGVDLIGEMKDHIVEPSRVVNLKAIPGLNRIETSGGNLHVGALVTLAAVEHHPTIRQRFTALADAAGSVGSPQIRNQGTVGGNLCQRPRCWYYRHEQYICLKKGGSRCYAPDGENKYHAILGGGPSYIVHPSDLAPALIALNATVHIHGPNGARSLPLESFYVLPARQLAREYTLEPNEIVTGVTVPAPSAGSRSLYVKFKERESMDWALSAVAVNLATENGTVKSARIVLGGVAPRPWRSQAAEAAVVGKRITEETADAAGRAAVDGAKPLSQNGYKVPLTQNLVRSALLTAAA